VGIVVVVLEVVVVVVVVVVGVTKLGEPIHATVLTSATLTKVNDGRNARMSWSACAPATSSALAPGWLSTTS
jgi:hypothetical protein